jgi:hypothetical protein
MKIIILFFLNFMTGIFLFAQNKTPDSAMSNNQTKNLFASLFYEKPFNRFYTVPNVGRSHKKFDFVSPPTDDKTYLDFVGTGDIQNAISGTQTVNANTGAGIVFERYTGDTKLSNIFQSLEVEMSINIATTSDSIIAAVSTQSGTPTVTNVRDFGTYIINPLSGKQAFYGNANFYFGYPDKNRWLTDIISGINCRFVASNNVWQYNATTTAADAQNINVSAFAFRIGGFHEVLPDNIRVDATTKRSLYSLFLGVNFSVRGLAGDISSPQNAAVRQAILGTTKTTWYGAEFDMGFRLNNLRLEFDIPVLSAGNSNRIPGLTNTQFLFTIRFIGGFGLQLNSSSPTPAPKPTT